MVKIPKSKKPRVNSSRRYIGIFVFFVLACVVYSARLINIQISGQDYYSSGKAGTYQRREIIYAERGEIFDRNGVPLVINEYTENIILDYGSMPYYNSAKNLLISQAVSVIRSNGDSSLLTELNYPVSGNAPDFYFDESFFADQTKSARFKRILKEHGLSEEITCETFVSSFLRSYGLTDRNGKFIYTGDDVYEILARRFDMEYMRFSEETPYILAENADISLISSIKESFTYGVRTMVSSSRKYCFPGFASHILGRMGKIPAGRENEYLEKGYSLDSYIGISGAEAAFENYLRGQNGLKIVTEDEYGYIIDETIEKAPVSGQDVYLTIDINLQIVAEYALKNNIDYIVENAVLSGVPLSGEDAKAGALSILEIGTNDVLALASYPSFNLATFNRDYSRLIANDTSPLLNRALNGMYTPGSTFKIAAAALSEGVVSATQLINDTGKYTYYSDYQPACWIYNRYGFGHGFQNIVQAIQNSCNYYFFESGRLLTIERLVDYCRKFGLGEKTGIELGETSGVLDCPEYREKSESDAWQVGDVLQVAIGQGKSMFSPLQLANYIATFITGERRSTHILSSVHQYGTDVVTFEKSAGEILDTVEISSYNRSIILSAMKNVVDIGSAASVFADYDITVVPVTVHLIEIRTAHRVVEPGNSAISLEFVIIEPGTEKTAQALIMGNGSCIQLANIFIGQSVQEIVDAP